MSNEDKRVLEVLRKLIKAYPDAPKTYLDFNNPFEMTIATILSARATDAGVNKVTPVLFGKYSTPKKLAEADIDEVAMIIRSTGAYNRKAEYITKTARMILEDFGGEVPRTIDELVTFPGVSRKTANVVTQVAFDSAEGVVMDTHIMRVSLKLGLTEHEKNPEKTEKDIMQLLPKGKWISYARFVGTHGRRTCKSRKPMCSTCAVNNLCPSSEL
ncbi:endonuclease III [Candidatus Thorarchaeota archaeon]|nr:MAG: endonuclease III [Candidatus Thorarchaeota archaeon]